MLRWHSTDDYDNGHDDEGDGVVDCYASDVEDDDDDDDVVGGEDYIDDLDNVFNNNYHNHDYGEGEITGARKMLTTKSTATTTTITIRTVMIIIIIIITKTTAIIMIHL